MGYCAILIPQEKDKKEEKDQSTFEKIKGKLMSGVTEGGLSFDNATTVLGNATDLIMENSDELFNKFSGVALTQLLAKGQTTNETAIGYLTQGLPNALGLTSVSMGFQSVDQMITALKSKNGVNVQQFFKGLTGAGSSLMSFFSGQKTRENVEGFDVIEVDAVISDARTYSAETPDRRVQSGQTYQEYVHNMPEVISLKCFLQNGRNYSSDEFEDIMLNLRRRKVAANIILGDTTKENYVLTFFNPIREAMDGYQYSLEFKKIQVGTVSIIDLNAPIQKSLNIIKNELCPNDEKSEEESENGYKKALDFTIDTAKEIGSSAWDGFKDLFSLRSEEEQAELDKVVEDWNEGIVLE